MKITFVKLHTPIPPYPYPGEWAEVFVDGNQMKGRPVSAPNEPPNAFIIIATNIYGVWEPAVRADPVQWPTLFDAYAIKG